MQGTAPEPALAALPTAAVRGLMLVTLCSVVLFFTIPKSKLVGYVLPAVPPLAWLMADASAYLMQLRWRQRAWAASLALGVSLAVGVVLWLSWPSITPPAHWRARWRRSTSQATGDHAGQYF